jgi:divalent metal cation (Fe/Co/Zn/Cd) transporter
VVGAVGVMLGFPLADPLVGILISITIIVLLVGTVRSIGRRLMDGIEPELLDRAEHAILHVDGVRSIAELRLRWVGHRLQGDAAIVVDDMPVSQTGKITTEIQRQITTHLPNVDELRIRTTTN